MLLTPKKRTTSVSFMVVPHYDAPVRTIRIPFFIIYSLIIMIVLGGVVMWQFVSRYNTMSAEIEIREQTNNTRTIALMQQSIHRLSNELEKEQRTVSAMGEVLAEVESIGSEMEQAAGYEFNGEVSWERFLADNQRGYDNLKPASPIDPSVSEDIDRVGNSLLGEKALRERSLSIIRANYEELTQRQNVTPTGLPCDGRIQDGFGYHAWRGRVHEGVDIIAPQGTPIYASASGRVITAKGEFGGYGNCVDILHEGGILSRYGHCHELLCEVGDYVVKGQLIAIVGNTGASLGDHLHYEVRIGATENNWGTAVDPLQFP